MDGKLHTTIVQKKLGNYMYSDNYCYISFQIESFQLS